MPFADTTIAPIAKDTLVIYLHIPKTAGTTFSQMVDRLYGPTFYNIHSTLPGYKQACQMFMQLESGRRQHIRCLRVMLPFGIHNYLRIDRPVAYITFLRNPVELAVSLYYYILRDPGQMLYHEMTSKNVTLDEFVRGLSVGTWVNNLQTRYLSGYYDVDKWDAVQEKAPDDTLPEDAFKVTKHNLLTFFPIVGIVERFDESILLMKKIFGWRHAFYLRLNTTPNRPRVSTVPAETLEYIRGINRVDLQLFDFFHQRLDEQIRAQGPGFQAEVLRFRLLNRLYGYIKQRDLIETIKSVTPKVRV